MSFSAGSMGGWLKSPQQESLGPGPAGEPLCPLVKPGTLRPHESWTGCTQQHVCVLPIHPVVLEEGGPGEASLSAEPPELEDFEATLGSDGRCGRSDSTAG